MSALEMTHVCSDSVEVRCRPSTVTSSGGPQGELQTFRRRRHIPWTLLLVALGCLLTGTASAQQADLEVHIDDGRRFFVPGNQVVYGVVVINRGPSDLTAMTLSLNLDSSVQSPAYAPGIGTFDSQTGLWNNFCLSPGGVATLVVSGTISGSAGLSLVSSVGVAPADGNTDPNSSNDMDTDTDLRIVLFGNGFESGDTSSWSFTFP